MSDSGGGTPPVLRAGDAVPRTVFVKLGGSLITDKRTPETPRMDVITRLAQEIAAARAAQPDLRLVLGHGSGSFGHIYGQRYGTRAGADSAEDWFGFAATADAAARLNRIVIAALLAAGVPAWAIQPSVALRCADGEIVAGPEATVEAALAQDLQPVVFGDVALDAVRGATIVGTEEIFHWLTPRLRPNLVVLLGEVDGIYTADPLRNPDARLIPNLTPATLAQFHAGLGASYGVDVTGGMAAKVAESLAMIEAAPGLEVVICSGLVPGNLEQVLRRRTRPGTWIHA
ncbi:MAG: isopentenyl phosphate kinase [Litorilinea sp.]